MPDRNSQNSLREIPPSTEAAPLHELKGSRWQVFVAGILLALWMAFLLAMSIYS